MNVSFPRTAARAFAAGLLMGAVYWALDIRSPAPPLVGLTGLFGIVAGERAASAIRCRLECRAPATPHEDPAHDR